MNAVRNATRRNQNMFVETCIQYLILDASLYEQNFEGAKWVMSPPLREKKDQETLWAGLNQGLVNVVATDHCPFMWEQKLMGKDDFSKIPNIFDSCIVVAFFYTSQVKLKLSHKGIVDFVDAYITHVVFPKDKLLKVF